MPVIDVTIVGKMSIPEISGGPGSLPPGIWGGTGGLPGGGNFPMPPIYYPPQSPGVPTHPIFYPPGINGGPGSLPPFPSHPIYYPDRIWGGGNQPFPTPPIYIPIVPPGEGGEHPSQPINEPPGNHPYWTNVFVPGLGWVWAIVPPHKPANGEGESENP